MRQHKPTLTNSDRLANQDLAIVAAMTLCVTAFWICALIAALC